MRIFTGFTRSVPFRRPYCDLAVVCAAVLSVVAPAAPATDATPEPTAPAVQSETERLHHRDRLITGHDFKQLAPQSPGANVHRPGAPSLAASPGKTTKALPAPSIDDRRYRQLRDDMKKKIPSHTPEWTDHNQSEPGAARLDPQSGGVKFGDGVRGARPSAGGQSPKPKYRHGQGESGNLPARPGPVAVPYPNAAVSSETDADESTDAND